MFLRSLAGLVGAVWVLLAASQAQAQCSKDTDCKGDRVCEGGTCVAAPAPLPPAPAAPAGAAAPTETASPAAPAGAAPAAAPMAAAPPPSSQPAPFPDEPMVRRRHSTGMMVGGIVMVSFTPIALLVAAVANAQQSVCETSYTFDSSDGIYDSVYANDCDEYDPTIYGGLISAAVLAGVGIPLIVIGGKKEAVPAATATISPWATARSAGVGLRIDM